MVTGAEVVDRTQGAASGEGSAETVKTEVENAEGVGEGAEAEGVGGEGAGAAEGTKGAGGEGEAAEALGADGKPVASGKAGVGKDVVPLATFLELKGQYKDLTRRLDDLSSTLSRTGETMEERLRRVEPPAKDPIEQWVESLPDGKPPAEEGQQGDAAYEKKRDLQALAPLLKESREALLAPITRKYEPVLAGVLQALDRVRFIMGQIEDSFVTRDEKGNITEDKRPAGLKHMDRIDAVRKESLQKSGGRSILRHQDAFDQVLNQVKGEDAKKQQDEERLRAQGADQALKRDKERTRAAGSPGNAGGPAPRGAVVPGRRTYEQIQKDLAAGKDFKLA